MQYGYSPQPFAQPVRSLSPIPPEPSMLRPVEHALDFGGDRRSVCLGVRAISVGSVPAATM